MGYSNDLRVRVIQVVEGGAAARAAARQFVIGDSTAIRWAKRWRETGSFEAKTNKGQSRSSARARSSRVPGSPTRAAPPYSPRSIRTPTAVGLSSRVARHAVSCPARLGTSTVAAARAMSASMCG